MNNLFRRITILKKDLRQVYPIKRNIFACSSIQQIPNDQNKKHNVVKIDIFEKDLEEKFSRGSGPGGQSVNKTSSKVQLTHKPTGIVVVCNQERDLQINRKIARTKLKNLLDIELNGKLSKPMIKIEKIKRRKSRARRRANAKYGHNASNNGSTKVTDNDVTDPLLE